MQAVVCWGGSGACSPGKIVKFAGNALEILILSRFCERLVSWNGYVLKENQRYGPSYPKVGCSSPPDPPPAQPLIIA